ncbi:OmpA family protein [Aeromonas caviae]|uniref:OmpA/MotB family protein n=1 Tax=Aeromonas caviae TaxID=648 RepID=UPI00244BCC7B|nr:OmpA family protein [Aeromonas caviae]MDH1994056.1 OmpA family protein [Aeromonas caviae]
MKDKPSEWIAISDLMSGVMAVVMLLLVVAVLQKSVSDMHHQQEMAKAAEQAKLAQSKMEDPMAKVKQALQEMMKGDDASNLMVLDMTSNRLTLADSVFERGSACLKDEAQHAVSSVRGKLVSFLSENPKAQIFVEGYTDNIPVSRPVTDYRKYCTVYDDNFTLSAARAREVRKAIIGELDDRSAKRIVVAGYGDSRPLPEIDASNPKNRRVEVRFLIDNFEDIGN